ncbi:MAG: DNA repair protein RecN, partial [Salinivirgaceae bacterium]
YNELKNANLKTNEHTELEQEQNRLSHSEEIAENLKLAISRFTKEEFNIIDELHAAKQEVTTVSSYFEKGEELVNRIQSSLIDLEDLSQDLIDKTELVQYDPDRLESINKRLNLIYSLQQKHNTTSIDDLLTIENDLEDELNAIESFEEDLKLLERKQKELFEILNEKSLELHKKRLYTAEKISEQVILQLRELGMPSAIFNINVL